VDVTANFPEECRYVLDSLRDIYRLDSQAKEQNLCQSNDSSSISATIQPVMEKLHTWLNTQIEQKQEPNSGLGKAIAYMLGHWEPHLSAGRFQSLRLPQRIGPK